MAESENLSVTNSLRNEILERIRLRTQINWFKLASLGALLGWQKNVGLWIAPFVAISFDYAILHNANYIHQIGDFLSRYAWWHDFESRQGQRRWTRLSIDLADRMNYLLITLLTICYSWYLLQNVVVNPHWLKCWWVGSILVLLAFEFYHVCLSMIRWPDPEKVKK